MKRPTDDVLPFLHALAEDFPPFSGERVEILEQAHHIYMQRLRGKRGRGRPKKLPVGPFDDPDYLALSCMYFDDKRDSMSARALAKKCLNLTPKVGLEVSRIDRLARKYTKMLRRIEEFAKNHDWNAEKQCFVRK